MVRVVENSTMINHVVFVGNSKVKSEDLEKEVQLKNHGAFSQAAADADVQRIMDVYRRAGRNAATVSVRTVETPNGTVDVVYDINEGEKTGIKEIRFVGNQAFSSGRLLGLMELDGNELPVVLQDLRRLRSRSSGEGRRGDPSLLPQERLCRLPRRRRRSGL